MDTIASSASFSFEPAQLAADLDKPFDIQLTIFSDTQPVISTDVWIQYDPTILQPLLPAKKSPLFETVEAKIVSPGRLYVYGLRQDPQSAGPANGTLASLTFKPLKGGSVKLAIDCSPTTSETSQIIKNDESLRNLINCERTSLHTATITVGNNVLGATDINDNSFTMWYLTSIVALLTIATLLYIRSKKVAELRIKD